MPPRKSTARQPSATPVKKSTRGEGALPDHASTSKRSLRSTSQAPDQTNGVRANLPEVQTQQSYAYGSTKTPLLPEQLRPQERMNLSQMAETIDQQRFEADQRFKDHAVEAETNLTGQPEAQTTRATRRRSPQLSPPREGSYETDPDLRKTLRTAAWAESLESDQLRDITEEESELIDDDNTRHGTDPSSFPSGIFDNSYNYERGLRRPRVFDDSANALSTFFSDFAGVASQMTEDAKRAVRKAASTLSRTSVATGKATLRALPYVSLTIFGLGMVALVMVILSLLFCQLYQATLCDPTSTSSIQTTLQRYCGGCTISSYSLTENMSPEQRTDISFLSKAVADLRRQFSSIETRINTNLDAKYNFFRTSLDELQARQHDLETHISKLTLSSSSSSSSSSSQGTSLTRINYFAPGTGAIINPLKSSPTLQRPPNFIWRQYQFLTGRVNYISNPPITGLEAWSDLGDCWCSAGSSDVRLAVKMGYEIFPTEITIEHFPASGNPNAHAAPRDVEIWASFAALSPEEYAEKGIWDLPGDGSMAPGMRRIGSATYDARPGKESAQSFRMDVNQAKMVYATDEVVVRVTSNHGASRTCLYRVMLHGVPVLPHPEPMGLDR